MKKICFFSLLILAVALGIIFSDKKAPPQSNSHSARPAELVSRKTAPEKKAPQMRHGSEEVARLTSLLSAPITMSHGGAKQIFELATDELYLRLPDGSQSVVSIPKASTPEEFIATIKKARVEHGVEPELVLYIAGAPRNEFSRRIVTREVVISAESKAQADTLAKKGTLVFKQTLVHAPSSFVYEAPTSLDALAMQLNEESINLAQVSTQFARQAATMSTPNDPFVQLQWHLKYQGQQGAVAGTDINVESVWNYPSVSIGNYTRGGNVTIGIVDDGLEWSHPDLAPNVLKDLQYDWNGKDNDPKPLPFDSHGTACAGVAAARGNNRIGVSGVAPEANLIGMRLIAAPATDLDEAQAFTWLPDQIHIKSNSWGYPNFSVNSTTRVFEGWYSMARIGELAEAALKYAADFGREGKGSIFTFSAGNQDEYILSLGSSPVKSGARVDFKALPNSIYTIAVGAVGSDGIKANYSQIGSSLLISGPSLTENGLGIMTTDNKGRYGYNAGFSQYDFPSSGDVTKNFSGTSASCPVVSGVVALMLEKKPGLGWRDVQEILIRSAKKIDDQFNNVTDDAATGWITANRTDHVTGNPTVPFHFNDKYGAGLVDAAAAVALSGNWTNLNSQKSQTVTTNNTTSIAADSTITRSFNVNGTALRVEHVTLQLSVANIKKGNLTITLTSPDNTTSTFCEPHGDATNEFNNWKFMTLRNWAESSNGTWTLTITNNGTAAGSLTDAELVVYGTELGAATNPAPVVTVEASRTHVFVGSNFTLNATAIDNNANATLGTVETLEAYVDGATLGVSENGTWTIQANKSGNYTFTVNATDSQSAAATSKAITMQVQEAPIAAWDFDTTSQSPIPLATAVQSVRKYAANFGSGNMTFNGSFDGNVTNSNKWEYGQGQIFTADGTAVNAVANMESGTSNKALLLRGGKNIGAEGKSIVFEFSMAGQENLNVSYAGAELSGGFTTHAWSWSSNGTAWTDLQAITPGAGYSTFTLNQTTVLNNSTTAYLRLQVSGSTAVSGQNFIDNIILSTSPITAPVVSDPFTVISKNVFKASLSRAPSKPSAPSGLAVSQPATSQKATEQNLDWVAPEGGAYTMVVHAEVVDGAKFLNAPGNLLSANEDGKVLGLAKPILQATSYKLEITSTDSAPQPLRLKVYDSKIKGILVLEEKVPFAPSSTIGTPSTPKRYKVAYQEAEQLVLLAPGWNTFTTAVDPDPATFGGVFSGYDYREGDQLLGPSFKATVVGGKWSPSGLKFVPRATYSLLRQAPTASQIILKGKEVNNSNLKPVNPPLSNSSQYGLWISLPPGAITTADWVDSDQDGIDDRRQLVPGQPVPQQKKTEISPASANPSGSQGGAPAKPHASSEKSSPKSKSSKKSKPSQKSKSLKSNKKNSGKKKNL
jgi:subtilisin-like proprotein convertase family protein